MPQFRARHYRTLLPVDVTIEDDLIADICEADCSDQEAANLPYVSPGLFDIQINGYNGIWFSSPALTTSDGAPQLSSSSSRRRRVIVVVVVASSSQAAAVRL